ncbi:iron-containing alcohol dehydrogenase [uncultured Parolsenella sp.]|uniref:iron-containing alcohol dehydrogenase n=1 Tax=uncultured Parolsenella sp. TaxID=2083008 RepID=UPI0025E492AE|nr:iron-containing alcohol dehydrogenase [uncultured Parolsenella sp.]
MAEHYNFFAPTRVLFGPGKLAELGDQQLPGKKALVVTTGGKSVKANGYLDRLYGQLDRAGVAHVLFDRIEPNPLRQTINAGGWLAREQGCDFVVALGGGSVMDGSKGICVVAANPGHDEAGNEVAGDIWDYVMGGTAKGLPIPNDPLPLVCVTTTAGTGSEADAGGVISCEENDEKLRLGSPKLFPRLSVVDPELMLTVPARLTAFQGFDALFHNVECFIANNHTLMGDMICREGIRNAAASLVACVSDGANLEARTQLAFANTLGGYAMVCSGCCGCHGTEHGMSAHHHDLPHGAGLIMIACAYHQHMIDAHACDDRYVEMARLMGASEDEVAEQGPSAFVTELARLKRECGVDGLAMSEWGITRDELPAIADNAITTNGALFGHDPVELSVDDVTAILEASWK